MADDSETSSYIFPEMTEAELRQARLQAFWSSTMVALLPVVVHLAWDVSDIFHWLWSRLYSSPVSIDVGILTLWVPDIALAGVIIAISAFLNTVFSFVKLRSDSHGMRFRRGTYVLSVSVILFSVFCFVQYLRTTHIASSQAVDPTMLFFAALLFAFSTFVSAISLQYTFIADELHCARKALRTLGVVGGE
jgi:hypothetical protein